MPRFKIRQGVLAVSGITTGSLGNATSKLQHGSKVVVCPSFGAIAGASGATETAIIANAAVGDMVFLTAASLPVGLNLIGAYISAASTLTMYFSTSGCQAIAAGLGLDINYLLISGS